MGIISCSDFLWSRTIYSIKKIKIYVHLPLVSPISPDCGMLGFILWMLWKSIIVRFCFQGCQTIFWLNFSPFGTQLLSCWQKLGKYEHVPPFKKNSIFWQPIQWIWNFLIGEQVSTTLWHPFRLNWSFLCSNTHGALHSQLGIVRIYFWLWTWALNYSV